MNQNKKGVEINISTIIIVILAVLVLVIVALYFTGGMKSLWEKIISVPGAYSETDIANAQNVCSIYCSASNTQQFCAREFQLKKGNTTEMHTCWDEIIKGYNLQECKVAGLNRASCATA